MGLLWRRGAIGLAAALGMFGTAPAGALPVYDTPATGELVGSRTVDGGGLTGFNRYSTAFTVSWIIDFDDTTPGLWHYEYTFTGLDGSGRPRQISHFTLDVSDDCFSDPACITSPTRAGEPIDPGLIDFDDIDGIIGAVKFDLGGDEPLVYAFDSNRAPVYGHLSVKDGGGSGDCLEPKNTSLACNNGLLVGADTMNVLDYVARPNSVPEPGSGVLLAGGLAALAWARGRRR